jgi:hypothetical protein
LPILMQRLRFLDEAIASRLRRSLIVPVLILLLLPGILSSANAADFNWSGFAEIGYVRSDQSYRYDRFVDEQGTLRRDSIIGAQLDAQFSPFLSAVVQASLAPTGQNDRRTAAAMPWAVLAWRPANDILVRVGKQRVPFYLNSENTSVGAAYNAARLPIELYSVAPNRDFIGVSLNKTVDTAAGEAAVDAYVGRGDLLFRLGRTELGPGGAPPVGPPQVQGIGRVKVNSSGVTFSLHRDEDLYRIGWHHFSLPKVAANPERLVSDQFPWIFTTGFSVGLPNEWRVTGEFARRHGSRSDDERNYASRYLTLEKKMGDWTPYLTVAELLSRAPKAPPPVALTLPRDPAPGGRPPIPPGLNFPPDAPFGQISASLGTSWASDPDTKWKAEWTRVRTGYLSGLVPIPPDNNRPPRQFLNVFSLSWNRTF